MNPFNRSESVSKVLVLVFLAVPLVAINPVAWANGGQDDHAHDEQAEHGHGSDTKAMIDQMREMHEGHDHEHDFQAMESLSPSEIDAIVHEMVEIGLAVPPMDPHRGRELFVSKGCVVCHRVNGVGGRIGPSLNAADMPVPMNAFEFAARMWRGADAMIEMQQRLFGDQIELSGQELADLVAFAHDEREQKKLEAAQVPSEYREMIQ
ncbi:MAG: c-type cytochrome [Halofilum sp. (in: g-proteobacteria)]|nr:c-type cytochrome [Halofilum sp. (in: g-proteobacteria)]